MPVQDTSVPSHFISCDWGTTNFRLRAVEAGSQRVVAEVSGGRGIREMHRSFLESGEADRQSYYLQYLADQIGALPDAYRNLPVVASGMASSSIGMRELKYAELPIEPDGRGLECEWLLAPRVPPILLVSGVKGNNSIMRGEEIQAVGLSDHLLENGAGTLVLPGTHSKHLQFDGSCYGTFTTYMTGELFELLSTKSILAASTSPGASTDAAVSAFRAGAKEGSTGNLSASLFGVRVRDVVEHHAKELNHYYLSGLLIGNELRDLIDGAGFIYLAANEPLRSLYQMALQTLTKEYRIRVFDADILDHALLSGQSKLLSRHAR